VIKRFFLFVFCAGLGAVAWALAAPYLGRPVPGYEAQLYADLPRVDWGDGNAFFVLAGLGAPGATADPYAWGRARALREAHLQEARKAEAGVAPEFRLGLPPYDWDADPGAQTRPLLTLDTQGLGEVQCLYDPEARKTPCATPASLNAAIARNRTLWDRFEGLPDYPRFAPVLSFGVTKGRWVTWPQDQDPDFWTFYGGSDLMTLGQMKAAQIILAARAGQGDASVTEWLRFQGLYRRMAAAPGTLVDRAVTMVLLRQHLTALRALIRADPAAVRRHAARLKAALAGTEPVAFLRADRMLADDLAASHGMMVGSIRETFGTYPTAAMRDMAACVGAFRAALRAPGPMAPDFDCAPFLKISVDDPDAFGLFSVAPLLFAPGGGAPNVVAYLLYSGVSMGTALVDSAHRYHADAQDLRRAIAALAQETP
jgi:hypothetical protein